MSSITSVIIDFPRDITGSEIREAVKAIANGSFHGRRFIDTPIPGVSNAYMIGQFSTSPNEHLLVAPCGGLSYIQLTQTYRQIEVRFHEWSGGRVDAIEPVGELIASAVRGFAGKLRKRFAA